MSYTQLARIGIISKTLYRQHYTTAKIERKCVRMDDSVFKMSSTFQSSVFLQLNVHLSVRDKQE